VGPAGFEPFACDEKSSGLFSAEQALEPSKRERRGETGQEPVGKKII